MIASVRPEAASHETKAVKTASQTAYDLIAKLEGTCLDSDPKLIKAQGASGKARAELKEALNRLSNSLPL